MNITNKFLLYLNENQGSYQLIDQSDYSQVQLAYLEVRFKLELITSAGTTVIYDNLSGLIPNGDPVNNPIPIDFEFPVSMVRNNEGDAVQGTYVLTQQYTILPGGDLPEETQSYTSNYIFDFEYPEVAISTQSSCGSSTFTSRDETNYTANCVSLAREHTISPPRGAYYAGNIPALPQTTTQAINVYSPIFDQTWTARVYSVCTFFVSTNAQEQALYLITTLEGSVEQVVVCDTDLCEVTCCLMKVYNRYTALKLENPAAAAIDKRNIIEPMIELFTLFLGAQECGNDTQSAELRARIIKVSGCDGCECGDDETPRLIVGTTAPGAITVVEAADNSVEVTSVTVGMVTTYRVRVSAGLQTIINNLKNVQVLPGTGITVVVGVGSQGQVTYTVSTTNPPAPIINMMEVRGIIEPDAGTWKFTPDYMVIQGAKMNIPSSIGFLLGSNYPTPPIADDFVVLRISNIVPTGDFFTARANVLSNYPAASTGNIATEYSSIKSIEAETMWAPLDTGTDFVVRIYSPIDGHIVQFSELVDRNNKVILSIQAIVKN